jgi:uncharacterized phage protein (TIGR02218 family)
MTLTAEYPKAEMEGLPEMYDIEYAGTHERFTSWSQDLTFLGYVFHTAPIKRSGFTFDKEFSNVSVTIGAPVTAGFERWISNAPLEPTTCTIYRALKSDLSEYTILFSGNIITVGFKNMVAEARCESNSGILNHVAPRIVYQSYCNHELFDGGCGLDYTAYLVNATVTVAGAVLSSATFDTYDDDYFRVGRCIFGSDERLITDHTGTDITLHMPFDATLTSGSQVTVLPGCNGSTTVCKAFNNFDDHFLGFPYIPTKNPVVWGV